MEKEWMFWVGIWVLSATGGTCRAVRDRDYRDLPSLVSVGLFSGLVGFGIVSIIIGSTGGHVGNEPRYLGMAALLGLGGKEQDKLIRFVIRKIFTNFGIIDEQTEDNDIPLDRVEPDNDPDSSDRVEPL